MTTPDPWHSLHLYYGGDCDDLLLDIIGPALDHMSNAHPGLRWFFLRYWNGGAHLRLRIKGASEAAVDDLQTALQQALAALPQTPFDAPAYAQTSARMTAMRAKMPSASANLLEPVEPLRKSGTVERAIYSFDQARYGTAMARDLIEANFCVASTLALRSLPDIRRQPNLRATFAALFTAAGWRALPLSFEERAAFARQVADQSAALMGQAAPVDLGPPPDALCAVVASTPDSADLPPLQRALLQIWSDQCSNHAQMAEQLFDAGHLRLPASALLVDFQHLMMNRMGLSTQLEPDLLRLIARAHALATTDMEKETADEQS